MSVGVGLSDFSTDTFATEEQLHPTDREAALQIRIPDHSFTFNADPDPDSIRLFTLMRIRILLQHNKDPLILHGPPWLHFEPLKFLNFADPDSALIFQTRIRFPKIMLIHADLDP
jgi:hypothetical protein